jgi:hypothetical protein
VGNRSGQLFPTIDGHCCFGFAGCFRLHRLRNRFSVSLETCALSPRFPDFGQNMVHSFLGNFFDHHFQRRQLLPNVPLPFLLTARLLSQFL